MANVFKYLDYRKFLRDYYSAKKEENRPFSFRSFARDAGFTSPNYMKLIMDGERNLSEAGVRKFIKGLKLRKIEAEFFENLVYLNQAKTDEERNFYYQKLAAYKKYQEVKTVEHEQFEYFSKWYFVAVRELAHLKDFRADPKWIVAKLDKKISQKEAAEAIDLLLKLGLLVKAEDGTIKPSEINISTETEVRSLAVANYHREMITKAAQSIEAAHHDERDISSLTVSVSKESFEKAKKMIQEFRRKLLITLAEDKNPDAVYQVNFQLFNLSEVLWKRG